MCGLFQTVSVPAPHTRLNCQRCGTLLHAHRTDPNRRALALVISALLLFTLAATQPFLTLELGAGRQTTLLGGPEALQQTGLGPLALVVLATTMLAPLARLTLTCRVLLGLHAPNFLPASKPHLARLFRWAEWMAPWSMLEVFLMGVFVAYAKLIDLAPVHIGIAAYALGAVMLMTAAADATLDRPSMWAALEPDRPLNLRPTTSKRRLSCDCCGRVSVGATTCPRCGGHLAPRSRESLGKSWALLLAAVALYIPANTLPILTVIQLGQGSPHTILAGVVELAESGLWPLAALVFTASVAVPLLKVLGLGILLITTQRRSVAQLGQRNLLYRVVEAAGRWSMIDVFMISILTALVQMGALATVIPGAGALCFCAVVILTMLAAEEFDPRLMWDAMEHKRG
jgi:paraquat-inducible protein A